MNASMKAFAAELREKDGETDRHILRILATRGNARPGRRGVTVAEIKGSRTSANVAASLRRLEKAGKVVSHRNWKISFKTGSEGYAKAKTYALAYGEEG